ncbi:MAG: CDP-alcohol phosphatidyltransferase family protein [Planctomycetota bacterium JB042]
MSRVSHSLLDPFLSPVVPSLYRSLKLPRRLPPEAIVVFGHLVALAGAVGFALSVSSPLGALLAAGGVAGNHLADMIDGTHARRTGQCRNGGELLDHFADPLSFAAWVAGIGGSCGRLDVGIAGVVLVYATALLTNLRAKITGEFRLARLGPTEFKALLVGYALALAGVGAARPELAGPVAFGFLAVVVVAGTAGLGIDLARSVREVNEHGARADTSEWEIKMRR